MAKLLLPNTASSMAGAKLDPGAIMDAIDFFDLKRDVQIKWSGGYWRKGAHRFRMGKHVITLSTHQGAIETTRTLWHELTHAMQEETVGVEEGSVKFDTAYRLENRRRGYKGNRFEVEARDNADAMTDDFALATQVARRTERQITKY